jgi:hypothetical protein
VMVLRQEGTGAAGGEVGRKGEGQRQGCPPRGGGPAVSPRGRSHGGAAAGAGKRLGIETVLFAGLGGPSRFYSLCALRWSHEQVFTFQSNFEEISQLALNKNKKCYIFGEIFLHC